MYLDELDREIIKTVKREPGHNFSTLNSQIQGNWNTVRYRVLRLERYKIVRIIKRGYAIEIYLNT